jgi:hypothetical protein
VGDSVPPHAAVTVTVIVMIKIPVAVDAVVVGCVVVPVIVDVAAPTPIASVQLLAAKAATPWFRVDVNPAARVVATVWDIHRYLGD